MVIGDIGTVSWPPGKVGAVVIPTDKLHGMSVSTPETVCVI